MTHVLHVDAGALHVDPEIANILGPIDQDERNQLRANLESDGLRDPIIIWANHNDTIVDGHHRYELCQELGIKIIVKAMSFPDRAAVLRWIVDNQAGRRNLSKERLSYIRGKIYNERKQEHGTNQHTGRRGHVGPSSKTCDQVAADFNVSPRTIKRDAKFAESVDQLPEDERKQVLNGKNTKKKLLNKKGASQGGNGKPKKKDGTLSFTEFLLKQSDSKKSVAMDEATKILGKARSYVNQLLTAAEQARGFEVRRVGQGKYKVQRVRCFPVSDDADGDVDLFKMIEDRCRRVLKDLQSKNAATFAYHDAKKAFTDILKAVESR